MKATKPQPYFGARAFDVSRLFAFLLLLLVGNFAYAGCPGCCSSHGGISSSCGAGGKIRCMDGTTSPSCSCSQCGVTTTPTCQSTTEKGTEACPYGQSGLITKQRSYTCLTSTSGAWGAWLVLTNTCKNNSQAGKVIAVADGDTLTVLESSGNSYVVRLAEIDAPEKCQPYGNASRNSLVALALNKTVEVVVDTTDRYGRKVAKVTVNGHPESTSKEQLRSGYAWVYDQYATDTSLDSIEQAARQAKAGLWAGDTPIEPWVWRNGGYGCSRDPETGGTVSSTELVTVTEFYNRDLKHYFMTASAPEALAIDGGAAGGGWERTGNTFHGLSMAVTRSDAAPVCRFYASGPNSHFYTADSMECQGLRDMESTGKALAAQSGAPFTGWQYEDASFKVVLPIAGICPSDTEQIFRSYNNGSERSDSNHRFTPWLQDIETLAAIGWTLEGVAMCAPK